MVALASTASFIMIQMSAEVSLIPPWLMRTGFISLYAWFISRIQNYTKIFDLVTQNNKNHTKSDE